MRSTPLLIEATPTVGHSVRVHFDDGTAADVDLAYLLEYGGVFAPLRDRDFFCQLPADPEAGAIIWPKDADIAPETLYEHARRRPAIGACTSTQPPGDQWGTKKSRIHGNRR